MGLFTTNQRQAAIFSKFCVAVCLLCSVQYSYATHEVGFLIDTSGSMVKNDPQNLRRPAIRLAAQMLPAKSTAGIWMFDGRVQALTPFSAVSEDWKSTAINQSDDIHARGQWTNIERALRVASSAFSDLADSKTLILLTDGRVDIDNIPSENHASRKRILEELLPELQAKGIQIHTIALSKNTDQDLLQRLSIGSNGMFALATTADDLMSIFLKAFDQTIAADQVPLSENKFRIDRSIKEFTALVFRAPGSEPSKLISPTGQLLTQKMPGPSRWFSDQNYDLITVSNPDVGEWELVADVDHGNRVTIVSDLELTMNGMPNNIVQGQSINLEFYLEDENGPIREPSLLSLLDIEFEQKILEDPPKVLRAKVTSHKEGQVRTPNDGIFVANLQKTLVNGEHQFTITVDGKTFVREQTKLTKVFSKVLEYAIIDKSDTSSPEYAVNLIPIQGLVAPDTLELTGNIKQPNGKIVSADIQATPYGTWLVKVPPVIGDQIHHVFVTVAGQTAAGKNFKLTQGPIVVDYSLSIGEIQPPKIELFDSIGEPPDVEAIKAVEMATLPESQPQVAEPAPPPEEVEPEIEPTVNEEALADESVVEEEAPEEQPEDGMSNWLFYLLIGVAHLLVIGGLAFFGLQVLRKKQAQVEAEDAALIDKVNTAKATVEKKAQEKEKHQEVQEEPEEAPEEAPEDNLTAEAAKISNMLDSIENDDKAI